MSAFGYTIILAVLVGGFLAIRSSQEKVQRRIIWSCLVLAICIGLFAAFANFRVAYADVVVSGTTWNADMAKGAAAMAGAAFPQIVILLAIVVVLAILALRHIK